MLIEIWGPIYALSCMKKCMSWADEKITKKWQ